MAGRPRPVQGAPPAPHPGSRRSSPGHRRRARDAGARGLPGPALLPPVGPALARIDVERKLEIAGLDAPDPELLELARDAFARDGLPSQALAVASGAFDAMERVLQAHPGPATG